MICRLVLSLRKASDPNLIRAWNVDHFSTQVGTQNPSRGGSGGAHLSPLRFRGLTTPTLTNYGEGNELMMASSVVGGSLVDSGTTTIDVPGEDESSQR